VHSKSCQYPLTIYHGLKDAAEKEVFSKHDVTWGSTPDQLYKSDDYRSLFNLVTHMDRRTIYDVVTKHIIAAILVAALKGEP
jgi:hypothetical protein